MRGVLHYYHHHTSCSPPIVARAARGATHGAKARPPFYATCLLNGHNPHISVIAPAGGRS